MSRTFTLQAIAIAHTAFKQKFGIPRQAGLVDIPALIELLPPYNQPQALEGLEKVSHIWLTFIFDQHIDKPPQLQVRPPRLGGNQKIGVLATRSSFRPNALGQSVVELNNIIQQNGKVFLQVLGLDVLDQTPIVDIKPYLPYADCIPTAFNEIAPERPMPVIEVEWLEQAELQLQQLESERYEQVKAWVSQLIALDPRPAYKHDEDQASYAMQLFELDIRWQIIAKNKAQVCQVARLDI